MRGCWALSSSALASPGDIAVAAHRRAPLCLDASELLLKGRCRGLWPKKGREGGQVDA